MLTYTRKLSLIILLILSPVAVFSQTAECPQGFICLTQAEANKARENALELAATKEKVQTLEDALKAKDASYNDLKTAKEKNEADLTERLNKVTNELATKTGQLIGAEAMNVRLTAIIDFMLKNGRTKKYGVINF